MDIGFGAAISGSWATPRNLAELARRAERLGYRSLWTFQRLFAPAGAKLAPVYHSVLDPMVSLGYLAAATSSIRLGVAVVNHPFQSPLLLAKQAATVDVLSGGRLDLGIGSGWLPEEFTGSGVSMEHRGARADEFVAALRALWSGGTGYQGTYLSVPAGRQEPRPVQQPGPPVLIGGMSRGAMERAGRIGDGWVTSSGADLSVIAESAMVVQNAARAAGRGPARIVCRGVVRPGEPAVSKTTGQRRLLSGSFEQIREDVRWLGSCGVTEVFYDMNFDSAVGDPSADEGKAVLRASEIMERLAPDARL
ncbi:MAG TPA: TIGR03619 family F420-dependent LLM class oxidoreductase [Trebonia sp.]